MNGVLYGSNVLKIKNPKSTSRLKNLTKVVRAGTGGVAGIPNAGFTKFLICKAGNTNAGFSNFLKFVKPAPPTPASPFF